MTAACARTYVTAAPGPGKQIEVTSSNSDESSSKVKVIVNAK